MSAMKTRKPYTHKEKTACEEVVHRLGTGRLSKAVLADPKNKTLWDNTVAICGGDEQRARTIISRLRLKKGKRLFTTHRGNSRVPIKWNFCPGCAREIASARWGFCPHCGMKLSSPA